MQVKIVNKRLENYREIKALLNSAFPKNERIPVWKLLLLLKSKMLISEHFIKMEVSVDFLYNRIGNNDLSIISGS